MRQILKAFNIAVMVLLLGAPFAANAQAVQTVGVLAPQRLDQYLYYPAFPETLRKLGYKENGNLRILVRSANGTQDRLPALASELVEARPDVIVAFNTPGARAAMQATKQIPIVISHTGDPVGSGFVSSLDRPGGNVTGNSNMAAELAPKRLAVLKEAVPVANRIAVLFNPEDPINMPQVRDAERAAQKLKIEIRFFTVKATGDLPETFKQMIAWRAQAAMWLLGQHQGFQAGSIELATRHRLPLMVASRQDVETGGVISYNTDLIELSRRTAMYVDRILKGTKPSDLPVELPTKFELAVNLKTAKALGLTIPRSVLLQASNVIE